MKTTLAIALALTLAGCKSGGSNAPETVSAAAAIPLNKALNNTANTAPEFDLINVAGGSIKSAELKGKVVVLDFWATDCEPCIEEIPDYNALYEKYKDKGVQIIGVTMESGGAQEIRSKAEELQMKYPVVVGNEKISDDFGGIFGTPTTFVLGRNWSIHHRYLGDPPFKMNSMEKDIQDLLAAD